MLSNMVRFGGGGYKHAILDLLVKTAIGFGVGALGDFVVEVSRMPVLHDVGTFGNKNLSNYEYFVYGLGTFGVVAGVADLGMGGGKGVFGFTRHTLPFFAGLAFGTYFYEHTIVNFLGLRNIDPYDIVSHALPPILPPSTPHWAGGDPLAAQMAPHAALPGYD